MADMCHRLPAEASEEEVESLQGLTIPAIKHILIYYIQPFGGNKQDLINRLVDFFDDQVNGDVGTDALREPG